MAEKKIAKVNFTAWFVLQGVLAAGYAHGLQYTQDSALTIRLLLARAAASQRPLSWLVACLPYKIQHKIGQFVTDAGRLRHFYFRKEVISKEVRALLSGGTIKQMIVLGSGLDVLATVLSRDFPHVNFIEVDVPETQNFKMSVYRKNSVELSSNHELLVGDLREPLSKIMSSSKLFVQDAATVWLAEGLLFFLPENSVSKLFKEIYDISPNASFFVFTSISTMVIGAPHSQLIQRLYLKKEKTPFKWTINPALLAEYLNKHGYTVHRHFTYEEINRITKNREAPLRRLDEGITIASCASL